MNSGSRNLPEILSDSFLILDKEGLILYSNPATTTITGFSSGDLVNKPLDFLRQDQHDPIRLNYELEQCIKQGRHLLEGWFVLKTNDRFWGEITLTPIIEEDHITGFTCILRDLSSRKLREIEWLRSEEQYRLMVESVTDYAIFMLDTTGHILTWNEGAAITKGYSPAEIIGKHFSIFYTTEDLISKKPERELKIAIATGKYEEEGWRLKKNGSTFWANVVITALFNDQNKHIGFSKVTRDLSERKQKDEELRQSEERYRSLVEQVSDYGIFMLDEKGRIINWNEGAKKIKGYSSSEIIGKYFSIFYPEEDIRNDKPSTELKLALSNGKFEEEGWRIRKDGTRFWAGIVITPVYNTQKKLIGFSKVTRDLTERKEAERALRESNEGYRKLAEELKATNIELSQANQELEQFTSIVSHDLQEPIRTIKSFLQLIQMRMNEGNHEKINLYLEKSVNAADRMKELIRYLLHYAQIGKKEIILREVKVEELLEEAIQNLRTSLDTSGASLEVHHEIETVRGDRIQLLQLIQNLLSNAIKFIQADHPEIRIIVTREDSYPKFAISDNGIGIAEEDQKKIFDIFRRLHTKKEYPGTGIGLAICKKIVDLHGGRIWPESTPGKGTTFYFTLNENGKEK